MSEPAVDASAYDLAPEGGDGRVGALCLHGLTGTPYEVRPIAEALAARGIHARGPVLPGHDTGPEELARVPFTAWIEAAISISRWEISPSARRGLPPSSASSFGDVITSLWQYAK